MTGETVLVTGGAGFIGSHACKALAQAGLRPVCYDNLSTGHRDAVRWGPLITGDVRDRAALSAALRDSGAGLVMHFAAHAYVGESVVDPAKYYDNNVGGMIALLDACRAAGVMRVVLSSSCAVYGVPDTLPILESTPRAPINPYGDTKHICERMLVAQNAAYGLRHVALRYFNAAGADPEGELGERHDPETHLIPLALLAAAGRRGPLDLYGTDYPTPDGTCIRDYVHVADLAHAHVLAARHLLQGGPSLALNIGSGRGHSVREVLAAIHSVTGRAVPVIERPRRAGDPPALYADVTLAANTIGFRAETSAIAAMIADAAPWFGLPRSG